MTVAREPPPATDPPADQRPAPTSTPPRFALTSTREGSGVVGAGHAVSSKRPRHPCSFAGRQGTSSPQRRRARRRPRSPRRTLTSHLGGCRARRAQGPRQRTSADVQRRGAARGSDPLTRAFPRWRGCLLPKESDRQTEVRLHKCWAAKAMVGSAGRLTTPMATSRSLGEATAKRRCGAATPSTPTCRA
jgi:hypothetical protein